MEPCHTLWWTNLLFINNIVPASGSFDDKCLPFAWFIPALVQVSLILPIVLWVYKQLSARSFAYARLFFAAITFGCWALVFTITYKYNLGALPVTILPVGDQNDPNKLFYISFDFYNKVYMQPWYWVGIYCLGIVCGTMFDHFLRNRNSAELTGPTLVLINLNKSWKTRAVLYSLSFFFMLGGLLRQKFMVEKPENMSAASNSIWATFGNAGFSLGFTFLVMSMLVGKISWLRSILAADMWQALSNLMPAFNMLGPITCLWFFLSTSAPLNYSFIS